MTTTVVTPDQDAIVSEIEIAVPPERIFQALTDPKQLILWWTNTTCASKLWEIDPRAGGKWRFVNQKASSNSTPTEIFGEIVEFDPPHRLAYSWLSNWHDQPEQRTLVRWELSRVGNSTRVKVTHSGLSNLPAARNGYSGGWPGVVEQLKNFAEKSPAIQAQEK
jgi:uncharacterized protein YndB with AHSA1/START domain